MRSLHADRRQYRDLCMAAGALSVWSPGQTDSTAFPVRDTSCIDGQAVLQHYTTALQYTKGSLWGARCLGEKWHCRQVGLPRSLRSLTCSTRHFMPPVTL